MHQSIPLWSSQSIYCHRSPQKDLLKMATGSTRKMSMNKNFAESEDVAKSIELATYLEVSQIGGGCVKKANGSELDRGI